MGVSVQHRIHPAGAGILQQRTQPHFHVVPVSMGHEKIHAKHRLHQRLRLPRRAAKPVAVSRHLIKRNIRIFLMDDHAVVKKVTKMDDRVGLQRFHALPHKLKRRMGIRQHQNLHIAPAFILSFWDYIIHWQVLLCVFVKKGG